MSIMGLSGKNAIERRIDDIGDLWNEFAEDPDARLLRWLVDRDSAQMIEVFLEVQNEETGDTPDLFVRFDDLFDSPKNYGFTLLDAFRKQYEESRDDIAEDDIVSDWICPAPRPDDSDISAFVRCCVSFREYYEELMFILAIVLMPQSISDLSAWQEWLLRLVRSRLPTNVRFMVLDDVDSPSLNLLYESEPKLVITTNPDLDMPGAYEELARDSGDGGPGSAFRCYFVQLTNAAAKGDIQSAERSADAALAIAREHNWLQMQVAVHMALGGAYLSAGKIADALTSYRDAGKASSTAEEQGDEAGPKMLLQARLAEGATLLNDGQYLEAAKVYEDAAPLAESQEDHLMAMESWRMAAYCYEMVKDRKKAWECGQMALDAVSLLDEQIRPNSTLPFIGQGLLRVAKRRPYRKMADQVKQRMTELVGPDWEAKAEVGGSGQ